MLGKNKLRSVLLSVCCCIMAGVFVACSDGGSSTSLVVEQPDISGLPPKKQVMQAAAMGDIPTLEALFAKDASLINAREKATGRSVLHNAVVSNNPEVIKFLLEKGADPLIIDRDDMTPYQRALDLGVSKEVQQLLQDAEKSAPASEGAKPTPAS